MSTRLACKLWWGMSRGPSVLGAGCCRMTCRCLLRACFVVYVVYVLRGRELQQQLQVWGLTRMVGKLESWDACWAGAAERREAGES